MVTIKKLPNKFTFLPSKAWWLFFGVLLLGVVVMSLRPQKASQPLALYLPASSSFFYHWSDSAAFENSALNKLSFISGQEPADKIASLKNLLLDGFANTQEIIWFRTAAAREDNFLLRVSKAEQIAKWLATNRSDYHYLLLDDDLLLISADAWLADNYSGLSKIELTANNLGTGLNIFWKKNEAPSFLADFTDWLKLDTGLPNIYANLAQQKDGQVNIHVWQAKLRQVINTSSTVEWPNKAPLPLNADLVLGFGEHAPDKWQTIVTQNILQPLFTDLPYYRLSKLKIEEQILKNNYIYLAKNKWLMLGKEDWQSRISDWMPNLTLKEVKNRLPDGTVYTEYLGDQETTIENLSYQNNSYWRLGQLYGAQIDEYYYLSNNESSIQSVLVSKYAVQSYVSQCQVSGDYQIIDLVQINATKIQDELIKKALLEQNINNLTILSYENSQQIGFKACWR